MCIACVCWLHAMCVVRVLFGVVRVVCACVRVLYHSTCTCAVCALSLSVPLCLYVRCCTCRYTCHCMCVVCSACVVYFTTMHACIHHERKSFQQPYDKSLFSRVTIENTRPDARIGASHHDKNLLRSQARPGTRTDTGTRVRTDPHRKWRPSSSITRP